MQFSPKESLTQSTVFHYPFSVKYASLQFFLTMTWKRFKIVPKTTIFFIKDFNKSFYEFQFDVKWWEDYFLHVLAIPLDPALVFCTTILQTKKAWKLLKLFSCPSKKLFIFKLTQMIHLWPLHCISSSTFIVS